MTKQFRIVPTVYQYEDCRTFAEEFQIGAEDVILTNPRYFDKYFKGLTGDARVIYARNYGTGEPTDLMAEAIARDLEGVKFKRMIAIGGGSIIDVSKLLVQERILPLEDLYDKKIPARKVKELVIVPTTCGTGSEVTNVAVIELTCKGTKMGLQTEEEFADCAVLIPEMLEELPLHVFAASSIDALIHASESYLSPKATPFSELYSVAAVEAILSGYRRIAEEGESSCRKYMADFLTASTYAGIAFGNAGCGAVHAMSMSFSGPHHVPHGESNYVLFTQVLKTYKRLKPTGKITDLEELFAKCLDCRAEEAYDRLEELLDGLLPKKPLHEYGVSREEIPVFVETVIQKQGRLTANNYTALSAEEMTKIYEALY